MMTSYYLPVFAPSIHVVLEPDAHSQAEAGSAVLPWPKIAGVVQVGTPQNVHIYKPRPRDDEPHDSPYFLQFLLMTAEACWDRVWASCKTFGGHFIARRPLARLLSTALCCIAIAVRPVSHLGGQYAFIALALKELVFNVQENLAQQLELTVLNIMGALLGIGFSTLAKYIASLAPPDSVRARATCAVFLVTISFFAGLAKSRLTRLKLSTRISCFVSTWLLTSNIGIPSHVLSDSGDFLFVTLVPASLCFLSLLIVMTLLRWHSTNFEKEMAASFRLLHQYLTVSLSLVGFSSKQEVADPAEFYRLRDQLFRRSINLNETYSQAAFELRVGRLNLKAIRPFISIVEHMRREIAWGMSPSSKKSFTSPIASPAPSVRSRNYSTVKVVEIPQEELMYAIQGSAQSLGHAILDALQSVEYLIMVTFQQTNSSVASPLPSSIPVCDSVHAAELRLLAARDDAREQLARIFNEADIAQHAVGSQRRLPKAVSDASLAMIALLQMSQEMRLALQVARRIASRYEASNLRLWYPRLSLAWLGVSPGPFISDGFGATLHISNITTSPEPDVDIGQHLTRAEAHQGLAEMGLTTDWRRSSNGPSFSVYPKAKQRVFGGKRSSCLCGLIPSLAQLWNHPRMISVRMWLSGAHRATQHSSHLKHAIKNAIGVALLSFPAFMPADSAGRQWFTSWHGQWIVISYLWVLETNTGATWRHGYLRLLGTVFGSIYAYIAWLICRTNPYGLIILVTLADVPITWLIVKTTLVQGATPASVAIALILFAPYIAPDPSISVLKLSLIRAVTIAIGMIAALLMNSLVFPRHCRILFLSDTSRALGLLSSLYMTLSHDVLRLQHGFAQDDTRSTLKLELQIRNTLFRLSVLITTMHDELSLLPKPLGHYRKVVTVLQKLLDLMTGLRKIRENIPRKETVVSVFNERREFMSCVCITIFACQHAFHAKEPLPQFLPSPRHALANLEAHMQQSIQRAREEDPHAMGLSLVYAFAEQEVMKNMVDALEEILELSGRLFGTSAWLTQDPFSSRTTTLHDEGDHGWYSTFRWEEA